VRIREKKKMGKAASNQMTLDFEAGLVERYQSLRECVATGVYQRGLGRVAIDLNQAPGNLSVQLSEDQTRHFSVDALETYIEKTRDVTPIYYLAEKFLSDRTAKNDAAQAQLKALLPQLQQLIKTVAA
jgi:hypothetical protein